MKAMLVLAGLCFLSYLVHEVAKSDGLEKAELNIPHLIQLQLIGKHNQNQNR
jgi:hypothetical protein